MRRWNRWPQWVLALVHLCIHADQQRYRAGTLSTSQMKEACIEKIQQVVAEFQKNRAAVTPEILASFQDATRKIDPRPASKRTEEVKA